jgi:hypothetical protein
MNRADRRQFIAPLLGVPLWSALCADTMCVPDGCATSGAGERIK